MSDIDLYIVAANASKGTLILFHQKTTPKCNVVDAVLASSAIPGCLPAGRLIANEPGRIEEPLRLHTLVDGGVWSNYPEFVFKDQSFRDWCGLGENDCEVIGFILHETDQPVSSLAAWKPHPEERPDYAEATLMQTPKLLDPPPISLWRRLYIWFQEKRGVVAETSSQWYLRTEAVSEKENTTKPSRFANLLGFGSLFFFLAAGVGPFFVSDLQRFLVYFSLFAVAAVLWLAYIAFSPVPADREPNINLANGLPRNRFIQFLDWLFRLTSIFYILLAVGCLLISFFLFVATDPSTVFSEAGILGQFVRVMFAWILAFGMVVSLFVLFASMFMIFVLQRGVRDWGWGVVKTFYSGPGAPPWRGKSAGDHVVRIPVPKGLDTLTFDVTSLGEVQLPDRNKPISVLRLVCEYAQSHSGSQIDEILVQIDKENRR